MDDSLAANADPEVDRAVALSFVDSVNRGDVEALAALMTDDHRLVVFDEPPVIGRDANRRAWRGYLESFPAYTIHPHRVATRHGGQVTVLGHTTGSHLGLPEEEESRLTLLWIAEIAEGLIRSWTLVEDTHASRRNLGLADDP